MAYTTYRTANRHSIPFKVRRAVRRTRTRVITELISLLEGHGAARA